MKVCCLRKPSSLLLPSIRVDAMSGLGEDLTNIADIFEIDTSDNTIQRLSQDSPVYIHLYSHTLLCSSVSLQRFSAMIHLSVATEPSLVPRSGIDVRAFLRSNTSLLKEEQNDTLKNIVGNRVPHDGIYH